MQMKYLLTFILLLLHIITFAQDNWRDDIYQSGTYAIAYRNEATGNLLVRARNELTFINGDDTIRIDMVKPEKGKIAFLGVIESSDNCLPQNAPVYLEFSNGESANFQTQTEKNCTGNVHIYLGGKWKHKDVLKTMQQYLVRKISIGGVDENHFYMLSREEALDLRKTVNCILYLQD